MVGDKLVINGVFDGFILRIKIAFLFALIGTCPVWLYQLWAFIAPGLCARDKKSAYLFTFTAVPLFVGGAVLAYVVMDRGLHYLLNLTPQNSLVLPSWTPISATSPAIWSGSGSSSSCRSSSSC